MSNYYDNVLYLSHDDPYKLQEAVRCYRAECLIEYFQPVPDFDDPAVQKKLIAELEDKLLPIGLVTSGVDDRERRRRIEWRWFETRWGATEVQNCHEPQIMADGSYRLEFGTSRGIPLRAYDAAAAEDGFLLRAYYYSVELWFCGKYVPGGGSTDYGLLPAGDDVPEEIISALGIGGIVEWLHSNEAATAETDGDGVDSDQLENV